MELIQATPFFSMLPTIGTPLAPWYHDNNNNNTIPNSNSEFSTTFHSLSSSYNNKPTEEPQHLNFFFTLNNDNDINSNNGSSFLSLFNNTFQNGTIPESDRDVPEKPLAGLAGILIPLIYGMVCVVGLVGNTLVIHVIVNYTKKESVTNIYILNLAIADELFMLGLPFLAVQNALLSWPFGTLVCRVVMTVDAINQFTSIFCLTVMSVDRWLAVVHPIRSFWWRRPRVAKAVSVTVWAGAFIVVLPVVVYADVLKDDGTCSIVWPEPAELWKTWFIVYTFAVGFFCPLLVICLCYLLIVVKVRSVGKRAQATSSRRRKSERKITRMVVVVVAVFVFCWLPFYALNIVNLLIVLPGDFRGLYFFVVVLSYANSCANPILYGFLSDNFKRGFRKALCGTSRRIKNANANNNERLGGTEVMRPTEEWGGVAVHEAIQEVIQEEKKEKEKKKSSSSEGAIDGMNGLKSESENKKDLEEEEEEGEEEEEDLEQGMDGGTDGGMEMEMSEVCKMSKQNGVQSGIFEDGHVKVKRTRRVVTCAPGDCSEIQNVNNPELSEPENSVAGKSRNAIMPPSEESPGENAMLEISYL